MSRDQEIRAYTSISLMQSFLKMALGSLIAVVASALLGFPVNGMIGVLAGFLIAAAYCRVEAGTFGYGRRNRG